MMTIPQSVREVKGLVATATDHELRWAYRSLLAKTRFASTAKLIALSRISDKLYTELRRRGLPTDGSL